MKERAVIRRNLCRADSIVCWHGQRNVVFHSFSATPISLLGTITRTMSRMFP